MKLRRFERNNKAQVLGLPMYLIIIMIVAVAVIAAVLFMIPQGNKVMKAVVTENPVVSDGSDPGSDGVWVFSDFEPKIVVQTADERGDPIVGATVRLSGGGVVTQGTTDNTGTVVFDGGTGAGHGPVVTGAKLEANINEAYMKLTVKAAGFEDFTDDSAVLLYRPT